MLGMKPPAWPLDTTSPTESFVTVRSMMMRSSGVICGVDREAQHGLLERHRRRTARRGLLVRDLRTLEDAGLALVRRHDARRRDDAAVAFGLQRRQLEVDEVVVAEDREGDRAGRARDRQVDVVARGERRRRHRQGRAGRRRRAAASRPSCRHRRPVPVRPMRPLPELSFAAVAPKRTPSSRL